MYNGKIFSLLGGSNIIMRRVRSENGAVSFKPMQTVAVTFASTHLPKVYLDSWRHEPGSNLTGTKMSGNYREYKKALIQFLAGGIASVMEVSILYPLDLLKTQLQVLTQKDSKQQYYGIDIAKKLYKNEGILAFYKGVLLPTISEAPKKAIKFMAYEQLKKFFTFGTGKPTIPTFFVSGMVAGCIEGIFINPFEVVKVSLQTNVSSTQPSAWSVAKKIAREEGFGLKGLNKGLTAIIARNAIFNSFYFGLYYGEKEYVPVYKDSFLEFCHKLTTSFASAVFSSYCCSPFDMAKSRIQGPQPNPGITKYKSTIETIKMIVKEEGFLALYTGMKLKIGRVGGGGAILLTAYDYIYDVFEKKFLPKVS